MRQFKIYDPETKESFIYTALNREDAARRYAEDYNFHSVEGLLNKERLIKVDGESIYIYARLRCEYKSSFHQLTGNEWGDEGWF